MTDINIHGYMHRCQRYVYYDVDSPMHAGGGSIIDCTIQSGIVPDPDIPAIDVSGDFMTLNPAFHDISFESYAPQKVQYNFRQGVYNTLIYRTRPGSQNITGNYANAKFIVDRQYKAITSIESYGNNEIKEDSYWNKTENVVHVYLRVGLTSTSGWEKLVTLPTKARTKRRFVALNDAGEIITFYMYENDLYYNAATSGNCTVAFDYIAYEATSTGYDV